MRYICLIFTLLFFSCTGPNPEEQLQNLSGYWEITQVKFTDGSKKDFAINSTIDFITLEDSIGIRKKLAPTLKGTYYATKSQESFTFSTTNEGLVLSYQTPFDSWTERVIKVDDSLLIVQNTDGKIYTYKRFNRQINLEEQ